MRKWFLLVATIITGLLFLFSLSAFAQNKTVTIQMKNGVTLTGKLLEFNPTSFCRVSIAGVESIIKIDEIVSLAEVEAQIPSDNPKRPVFIEDISNYPDTILVDIGPIKVRMLLIPGGQFKMGYDGKGSLGMNSEPVHEVYVHSFYVNLDMTEMNDDLRKLVNKKKWWSISSWDNAAVVVNALNNHCAYSLGLITEAQWEYLALKKNTPLGLFNSIGFTRREANYCHDFFGQYPIGDEVLVDPVGPEIGNVHVVRAILSLPPQFDVYKRYQYTVDVPDVPSSKWETRIGIRFTFPAKEILEYAE